MFLKNEPFDYNGQSVTLTELSALQRINHLAALKAREETGARDDMQMALDDVIREGACLVAMSLWHTHPVKGTLPSPDAEMQQLTDEVMQNWPVEGISLASVRVMALSGMIAPAPASEDGDAEVVTAGKSSKTN
ncbi:phage tail assembly chaperone G [Klebsiella pneumoniae]|uniref:phage tail assembly chaperone G n=1 Tax=Klebsiella pneumoniae complex TaxID=3390273 RepID=UPI0012EA2FFD|nr:phage minor tail protein G [Klebsiella pneumoniae]MDP0873482.1 phage minor tail protein G [Klebsiella pneumoniae]MDP1061598.1 phage minor tail protein G [Klebsiella pneumoniae]MDP1129352.1 phage minor tail protein G [Klebsiella pneumoniae]MDP1480538.1 phage minor tail protein G [Klebsiella pneumoniae]MDP1490295.1 phage minor tail protein G [Klebsiella pneumoniae]